MARSFQGSANLSLRDSKEDSEASPGQAAWSP